VGDDGLNRLVIVAFGLAAFFPGSAARAGEAAGLFDAADPIAVSLEGPMTQIARDKRPDPAYRDATLVWADPSGTEVRIPVKIKPRGKSRRNKDACKFPPLRLNLAKHAAPNTPFADLDKIKLVTHCGRLGATDPAYAGRVRLELLLYRVFSRISPIGLRVRAMDVTYVDSGNHAERSAHAGFLIEPEEMLARRTGMAMPKTESIEIEQLDAAQASLVEMFEYFAGNTDFSMTRGANGELCCHNVILLQGGGGMVPVPYDFDATGVVGAPYARPAKMLGIRNVQTRLYRGYCRPEADVQATLDVFRQARPDIYALFRDDERLDRATAEKTIAYLDEFYATIDRPDELKSKVLSRCL
jgi:hypothetical protein